MQCSRSSRSLTGPDVSQSCMSSGNYSDYHSLYFAWVGGTYSMHMQFSFHPQFSRGPLCRFLKLFSAQLPPYSYSVLQMPPFLVVKLWIRPAPTQQDSCTLLGFPLPVLRFRKFFQTDIRAFWEITFFISLSVRIIVLHWLLSSVWQYFFCIFCPVFSL